jgi:hypothetical protein
MLSVELSAFNPGGVGTKLRFSFGSYVLQHLGNALRGQISTAKINIFSAMYNVQDKWICFGTAWTGRPEFN